MSSIMHATAHHVLVTLINLHNNNQYVVHFNMEKFAKGQCLIKVYVRSHVIKNNQRIQKLI